MRYYAFRITVRLLKKTSQDLHEKTEIDHQIITVSKHGREACRYALEVIAQTLETDLNQFAWVVEHLETLSGLVAIPACTEDILPVMTP
jgi:hypothetical protein